MNHNDIRHKLSDYIDAAVSDAEQVEIEAHLKTCSECSNALDELRKTIEQVKQIEEVEAPAWMTAKIMAKVREEESRGKSFWHRLFYPLAIKVPIQTVAVLFLSVTAYYLYQSISPTAKYAESPKEGALKKDAPAPAGIVAKEKAIRAPEARAKQVEQEPGYKALDMKYEYEKPIPPVPVMESAPAPPPVQTAAPPKAAAPMESRQAARLANAPEAGADKLEDPAEIASAGTTTSAPRAHHVAKLASVETRMFTFFLSVRDVAEAEGQLDRIIRELKGAIVRKDTLTNSRRITISMEAERVGALREKIEKIGALKKPETVVPQEGIVQLQIMLTPH